MKSFTNLGEHPPTAGVEPETKSNCASCQPLAPAAERSRFEAAAVAVKLPAGKQMLALRETPGAMAFPVTGAVRVYLVSREGVGPLLSKTAAMGGLNSKSRNSLKNGKLGLDALKEANPPVGFVKPDSFPI